MFPSQILLLIIQLFLRILTQFLPHESLARDFEWFRHNLAFSDLISTKDILISAVKLAVTLSLFSRVSQTNVVNVQTGKLMLETSFSG